jgi:hypothetical protein
LINNSPKIIEGKSVVNICLLLYLSVAIPSSYSIDVAVAWKDIVSVHETHVATITKKWHACLAMETELSDLQAQHSSMLADLRSKWSASLDKLEASTATQLKELEAKLKAKRKKSSRRGRDPAVMQHLLSALL